MANHSVKPTISRSAIIPRIMSRRFDIAPSSPKLFDSLSRAAGHFDTQA